MAMVMERVQQKPKTTIEKVHTNIRRGDIWICDISGVDGSVQSGINRPCVVLQNELGNKFAPTVIIAPLSSSTNKAKLPTHVDISRSSGLVRESIVLLEQVRTIDQWCLINKITQLDEVTMLQVDKALVISLGLSYLYNN